MAPRKKAAKNPSDLVDAQLELYRSKRDFAVTGEPSGRSAAKAAARAARLKLVNAGPLPFVIQKHAATRLHYDFRLGWNGVLKSWAVAKGPSYLTRDKRLAVQVEDHPMDYGGFEGIIPKGQYGGGTVMLWDTGTWEPQSESGHTDVDESLRRGSLKFILHGTKMKGKWALVRMGGKAANESKPNWLLIKEHDDYERTDKDPAIIDEFPNSAVTKRTMEQIAKSEDHIWQSKGARKAGTKAGAPHLASEMWERADPATKADAPSLTQFHRVKGGKSQTPPKESLPAFIPPQLANQTDAPPIQSGWLHELKLDGYRMEGRKDKTKVQLLTRTGLDWTHRMKAIAAEIARLPAKTALLDGEVVVLSTTGATSFADLQAAFHEDTKHTLTYVVFDLLHLDGRNLRGLELTQRKEILASLFAAFKGDRDILRLNEHLEAEGAAVFREACKLHAEGIVSKRVNASYTSGRTGSWLKIKCARQQEFIIGGFTLPSNKIHGVGALLLGYYDAHKKLIYAGRTGTGFTQKTHRLLRDQLDKLRTQTSPFESMATAQRRGAVWVTPQLVAQVNFATWTSDNLVRQAAFKGLREDKPAKEVRREAPIHLTAKAAHTTRPQTAAKTMGGSNKKAGVQGLGSEKQRIPGTKRGAPSLTQLHRVKGGKAQMRPTNTPGEAPAPIRLTHPDKVLDTESKLTKQQLADYYWQIADHILPQIANRPLSLVRCPEGSTQPCFFQKHTSPTLASGIETIQVPDKKTGKPEPYITLSTREALAGLAQMGVLELHPWGSRNNDLEHPDRIVIDLDPDESIPWPTLAAAAKETRALLKKLGLEAFLKSTGGKGLHVVVPIVPDHDWATIKQFAHAIALQLEKQHPGLYLAKMSKAARKGRIFVDYLRNERGATAVAAFSPRARAGASVSIPLDWSELDQPHRPVFHVADFPQWRQRLKRDPWKKLPESNQKIDPEKAARILQ